MCRQSAMRVMRVALRAMRVALRALAILAVAISIPCARADSLAGASASPALCASTPPMTAAQQDRLLRFAQVVRRELEGSGRRLALISRKGTSLARFGIRYSHAGIALEGSRNGPWSVRQLYYACDERRPRVFDQGLAGFVLGTDDPGLSYVSVVLLPRDAADALERTALDDALAVRGLASTYSANAHAFATLYQNCNQWLVELMALAWGARVGPSAGSGRTETARVGPSASSGRTETAARAEPVATTARVDLADTPRAAAQRWLAELGYAGATVDVGSHLLMAVAPFIAFLRWDDHPIDDLHSLRVRTSLPAAIEAFVHARLPDAERIELCHDERRVVIRRGWEPLPDGCVPGPSDRVVRFD